MAARRRPKDGFKEKKTLGWLQGRRRHEDGCKEGEDMRMVAGKEKEKPKDGCKATNQLH
jgi:hypothetical protein